MIKLLMSKQIITTIVFIFSLMVLWSCKSLESIEENPNNNTVKQEVKSPNDFEQSLVYSDINLDDRVFTGQMANGMKYYIMPNSKPDNRAELRLVVKAGSIDEDYDQLGLAHFIEHMAFNGTKNFNKNELVDYLESVGTKFGPDLNAYTSFDETVYMLQVRTDKEEQLKKGLLVLSDWASGLTFDEEEIEKERGVVISEWRTRLSSAQRMQKEFLPVLLKGSRYANRLPIGDPEIIKNADAETIKRFYYQWYRPDLMAVVAVGDFNPTLIEEYISDYFSSTPKAVAPREKKKYSIPQHDQTLVSIATDNEAPITQVRVINKLESQPVKDVGDFRDRMVSKLFTQMLNARLSELTQSIDAPFLYASCYQGADIGPMDTYSTYAACKDDQVETALKALIRENLRVKKFGFTPAELDRAKSILLKAADNAVAEADKMESGTLARRYIQNFLTGQAYMSPDVYHALVNKYVPRIPVEQVNSKSRWFSDSNRVVIVTGPEEAKNTFPARSAILEYFEQVSQESIEPYTEKVNDQPLLSIKLTQPQIENSEKHQASGFDMIQLKNGATVWFKSTDFNNDEILFKAISKGGHQAVSDDEFIHASHGAWIIRESGLGDFSSIDLERKLAGKKVAVRPFFGVKSHGLSGNSGIEEAEILGQLIYMNFTKLRRDSTAFISFQDRMSAYYGNLLSDPSYYFSNEVARIVSNDNLRALFPTSEDIEKIEMEKVFSIFDKLYAGVDQYHFIFSGNLNDTTRNTLLSYINAIPVEKGRNESLYEPTFMPKDGEYVWSRGEAPKSFVEIRSYLKLDTLTTSEKDDWAYLKGLLDILLREELREELGGVYGVRTFLSTNALPDKSLVFGIGFTADPEMANELITSARMVILKVAQGEFEASTISKVKEGKKSQFEKDLKTNEFWLNAVSETVLKEYELERFTWDSLLDRQARISVERMQELAKLLIEDAEVVTLVQNPE